MSQSLTALLRMFSPSRRHFMRASAIASGLVATTVLSHSTIAGIALAEAAAQDAGDLGILNFALTLEHFENVMYRNVIASGVLSGKALDYAKTYGDHENTHVAALTDTISKLGGTPVKEQAAYNFPALTNQDEVLKLLATVEDVGASAYLGAAPLIKDGGLLTVAVQIHTVEALHATAMRFLTGQDPVPFAFAPPRTGDEVLAIVTPFLTPAAGTPGTMPPTGANDNNMLTVLGVAGGIAAAAGLAMRHKAANEASKA